MGWFTSKPATVKIPLTPEVTQHVAHSFGFSHEWQCRCGSKLKIRSREPRSEDKSNLTRNPNGYSYLPAHLLNWNGLAEERNWQISDNERAKCPACVIGISVKAYKKGRRGV